MKRLFATLGLAAATSLTASLAAQQLSVGYGGYTQMDATNCHKGFDRVDCAWGALNASLWIPVSRSVSLGASYTFSSASTPEDIAFESVNGVVRADDGRRGKVAYHAILLNTKVDYWRRCSLSLYAHVGVGAIIAHMQPPFAHHYGKGYFAYQISPLGAEVGLGKHVAMFAEVGFGAQGLAQVGFNYDF
jgi:hypothetical protein